MRITAKQYDGEPNYPENKIVVFDTDDVKRLSWWIEEKKGTSWDEKEDVYTYTAVAHIQFNDDEERDIILCQKRHTENRGEFTDCSDEVECYYEADAIISSLFSVVKEIVGGQANE